MPRNPTFELFELICQELSTRDAIIIPEDDVEPALIEDLKEHYEETSGKKAFERSLAELKEHFEGKGSKLPFEFSGETGEFRALDKSYIAFIVFAANRLGVGGSESKEFEIQTLERLARRLTGAIHRVGTPRDHCKRKAEFVRYLKELGFEDDCLEPRDQDGGLDILWLPPLGTIPLRPIVSVQCKNSSFSEREANQSVGRATRTLQRHSHIRGQNHLYFVVFNDYIDEGFIGRARGWTFIPLGLSDLGEAHVALDKHVL